MAESPELIALATAAATAAGIPPHLFLGLVRTESNWNPAARSAAGALGLAQVMPIWASPRYAAEIGMTGITPADLTNPTTNLTAGARILAAELRRFGSWELAAMAYNAGAGAVNNAIKKAGTREPSEVSRYLPAAETRAYWQKVMNWADAYAQKISGIQAAAENVATEAMEEIKETSAGTATTAILVVLSIIGAIIWIKR